MGMSREAGDSTLHSHSHVNRKPRLKVLHQHIAPTTHYTLTMAFVCQAFTQLAEPFCICDV
jgi:hypothetical protein